MVVPLVLPSILLTKVNTCYTGGVRFLEAGDRVMVRNTDNDRY